LPKLLLSKLLETQSNDIYKSYSELMEIRDNAFFNTTSPTAQSVPPGIFSLGCVLHGRGIGLWWLCRWLIVLDWRRIRNGGVFIML
jgi:hypothetical protein